MKKKNEVAGINFSSMPLSSSPISKVPEFSIARGKYDADYVVNLCKQIMQRAENAKHSNIHSFIFSLGHSLRTLIANIECEKMTDPNRPKAFRCDYCGEMYLHCQMTSKSNVLIAKIGINLPNLQ